MAPQTFINPFDNKWIVDETSLFWDSESEWEGDSDAEYSKIRVTFSRNFTWSERETFRRLVKDLNASHVWKNGLLYIEANLDSRQLMKRIQKFVAAEYVNIHPRAVMTIQPKVNV